MLITSADVAALERGVSLLASGGSGGTAWAAALLRAQLAADRTVSLRSVTDLPEDATVIPIGGLGAEAMLRERLPAGGEAAAVVEAISRWCGCRVDALMSYQVGGLNGIMPFIHGLELDLPWVDADLAGRGLARLDRLTVVAAGRKIAPLAIATSNGQLLVLAEGGVDDVERSARAVVAGGGGWAVVALPPIRVRELADCAVVGSVTQAIRLGREALAAGMPLDAARLASAASGRVLGTGHVVEVLRGRERPAAGFARGSVIIETHCAEGLIRLEMENEYLLALVDGVVTASTPDVICVLDRRTGEAISSESVRLGIEVAVLQLPAPGFWTDRARSWAIEPASYGLPADPAVLP
ncbi:DUF917 domain-containing protein [Amycolatopsis jejuensis]|uniref:DUF917 domain-containing protein n=1 Tax=Amycolatopsis jejuensis TaxID=330084 RepID=UPI000527CB25|nr:DUF917 domain-containing protein [Amycolatopsis jejuensis]